MRVAPRKDAIYQPISQACELLGFSKKFLLAGCKNGVIPHIVIGRDYRINLPLYLSQLEKEAVNNGN